MPAAEGVERAGRSVCPAALARRDVGPGSAAGLQQRPGAVAGEDPTLGTGWSCTGWWHPGCGCWGVMAPCVLHAQVCNVGAVPHGDKNCSTPALRHPRCCRDPPQTCPLLPASCN